MPVILTAASWCPRRRPGSFYLFHGIPSAIDDGIPFPAGKGIPPGVAPSTTARAWHVPRCAGRSTTVARGVHVRRDDADPTARSPRCERSREHGGPERASLILFRHQQRHDASCGVGAPLRAWCRVFHSKSKVPSLIAGFAGQKRGWG